MPSIRISVIVPKKALFDKSKWIGDVKETLRQKTEPDLRRFFKGTTEGWKDQPDFFSHHFQGPNEIGVEVYTRDAIYGLVNAGSPPHRIPARRGGMLRFRRFYKSSTRAGSLRSGASSRFGPLVVTALVPRHPGFKARKFDEQIAEVYQGTFAEDIAKTFKAGLP